MNDITIIVKDIDDNGRCLTVFHSPDVPGYERDVIIIGEKRYTIRTRAWRPLMVSVEVTLFVEALPESDCGG